MKRIIAAATVLLALAACNPDARVEEGALCGGHDEFAVDTTGRTVICTNTPTDPRDRWRVAGHP